MSSPIGRLGQAFAIALLLPLVSGCVTDGLLRMARNDGDLTSAQTLRVEQQDLEAAFSAKGGRHSLPRSAVTRRTASTNEGFEALPVAAVSPYSFDWKNDLDGLRPPKGARHAILYQGRAPFFFHLRKLRLAYLREEAEGEVQVAVFELGPGRGKQPLWYFPVPVAATVEAFGSVLLLGFAVGLAGLAL